MTRKITVSLPDDIAERLEQEKNVSAFVADSIRRRMEAEHTRRVLVELGFELSPEGTAAARARYEEAVAKITPEMREETAALLARARRGRGKAA
jgi:hypothetical protein